MSRLDKPVCACGGHATFRFAGVPRCGPCARAHLGRCPTCGKPDDDPSCGAYRPKKAG
jgi:hypothetical protein